MQYDQPRKDAPRPDSLGPDLTCVTIGPRDTYQEGHGFMMRIPKDVAQRIIDSALGAYPQESCGIISGRDGVPTHVYEVPNVNQDPTVGYLMSTEEQFRTFRSIRHNNLTLIGIYHSHPRTEAYPSPTDVELAYYPEAYYVIVSLRNIDAPTVRSFRIREGLVSEEIVTSGSE
jgi:proteasome lid subunit RPN8/RPN11